MKKVCHKQYFIGCYGMTLKEVPRETFLKCLKNITRQEYKMLINEKTLWRNNVCYRIENKYEMIEDEFDLMLDKVWETFECYFYAKRAWKIIQGIKCREINKENLCEKVAIFTKRVKSKRSLEAWSNLVDWFSNVEWGIS